MLHRSSCLPYSSFLLTSFLCSSQFLVWNKYGEREDTKQNVNQCHSLTCLSMSRVNSLRQCLICNMKAIMEMSHKTAMRTQSHNKHWDTFLREWLMGWRDDFIGKVFTVQALYPRTYIKARQDNTCSNFSWPWGGYDT